ncbi:MAG: Fibronectin type III domain protein [bacterium ADurb.Bin243]|nr:MAG: Fibronectin type III domain protein [bacterium ADurb.Bin243]
MRPIQLFTIIRFFNLKKLIFFILSPALVLTAFTAAAYAAPDYNFEAEGPFARLDERWKTGSSEIEIKFKNLSGSDIEAIKKRLYYTFITVDEFDFLISRLLKSENEKAHELAGVILNDPEIGYYSKMSILSTFRAYLSAAGSEKVTAVQRIAENFAASDICKTSERLYITSLKAIAAAKNKTAEAFFISRFKSEENAAVKKELLYELARLPEGVELLAAEYEKAVSKNELDYGRDILNSVSSLKTGAAYDYLYALMQKTDSEGANAPFYNFIRNCAARCASDKFIIDLEKLLVSPNTAEVSDGFEYLRYYPQNSARIALAAYSKISGERHKKFYLRKLAEFVKSLNFSYGKPETDEMKAVYACVKEAFKSDEPYLERIAFETLSQNLKNEDFKKLAETETGDYGVLMPLAFYLNGEKERFIQFINTPEAAKSLMDNREIISSHYLSFDISEECFKTEESTKAFFNFIKSQPEYFQNRMIEKIIRTGNSALIKKLAAFSSSCPPGFIKSLKRRIIAAINEMPELKNDAGLVEFSDYESSREYQNSLIFQKKFDAASGNLKKYLLSVKNAGSEEFGYAAEKISQLVSKDPQEFIAALKDDRFPADAKLMLIRAAGERMAELKTAVGAATLNEFICQPEGETALIGEAAALLAKIDVSAAFESLKTALKNSAGDSQRELAVLKAFSCVNNGECAEFIARGYIEPYLKEFSELSKIPSEKGAEDFFKDAPPRLMTACELLNPGSDNHKKALSGLMQRYPAAAPALSEFFNIPADEETIKYHLSSFDIKTCGEKIIRFLRRSVTSKNIDVLKEFYVKSRPEGDNAVLFAALFYKNGIYAPASLHVSETETINRTDVFKLLEAGFSNDFITDFYPAGEKFINALTSDELKNFRPAVEAVRDFNARYAAVGAYKKEDAKKLSDGSKTRADLKTEALIKLKSLLSAGEKNKKSSDGESFEKCLNSYLSYCGINEFEEAESIIKTAVKNGNITPDFYAECAFRICSQFDAGAAGFDAMDLKRKNDFVKRIIANGYFDVKKAFPKNAYLYSLDFETLCAADAADIKFIDAVIKEHKGWNYEYIEGIFLARLCKTPAMEEKLKFITGLIDSSDANDNGQLLEMAGGYITVCGGEELKKAFASYYRDKLDKIKYCAALVKTAAENLSGEALREIISGAAKPGAKTFEPPEQLFTAYIKSGDSERFKYLEQFCESENYAVKNNALRSLAASGETGLKLIQGLFEKYSASPNGGYAASEYLAMTAETGGESAPGYLQKIAEDEKLKEFHRRAISEIGEIKTRESLEWLLSKLLVHRERNEIFNALRNMSNETLFDFLELEKKSSGDTKAVISSILYRQGIQKPFMELLADDIGLISRMDENFFPPVSYYGRGRRDVEAPPLLLDRALKNIAAELKKSLARDFAPDEKTKAFHSYICRFLALSRNREDMALAIELLGREEYARSASDAIMNSAAECEAELLAAARREGNPESMQKRLIGVLINKKIPGASDVYLKALRAKDRGLVSAAMEAVSKFKISAAIPALITMLDSQEGYDSYYVADCLASFGFEAFSKLLDAPPGENSKNRFKALSRIIKSYAYASDKQNAKLLETELLKKFGAYREADLKTALLISFLLADYDGCSALAELLKRDGSVLELAGSELFDYITAEKLARLGTAATRPLTDLIIKTDDKFSGFKFEILSLLEKIGDPAAAAALAAYLKQTRDGYIKNRILETISKISKDGVAAYLNILKTEKDYYLRRKAAKCLAGIVIADEYARAEILKSLSSDLEDEIKAVLIEALAVSGEKRAAAKLLEFIKNSRNAVLLESSSGALYKLGVLSEIRQSLKNIIAESKSEINQAYAARSLGYYQDSSSIDIIGEALNAAVVKADEFKKIELIKACAAINSHNFIKGLSIATSDISEAVRTAAATALKSIAGGDYFKYCAPGPPVKFKVAALDRGTELSWEAAQGKPASSFAVYRDGKKIASIDGALAYRDENLKNGVKYEYYIKAFDADSNAGAPSVTLAVTPSAPPGPVRDLKLTSGLTKITLEWKPPLVEDNTVAAEYFVVERDSKPVAKIPAGTCSYIDYGLSAGKIYAYKVYAVNRMGAPGEKSSAGASAHFNMKGGE